MDFILATDNIRCVYQQNWWRERYIQEDRTHYEWAAIGGAAGLFNSFRSTTLQKYPIASKTGGKLSTKMRRISGLMLAAVRVWVALALTGRITLGLQIAGHDARVVTAIRR